MSNEQSKLLVNDEMAERYVIGSMLIDASAYTLISQYLDKDCFYNAICCEAWCAIDTIGKNGQPIDLMTVSAELAKKDAKCNIADLIDISHGVATSVNAEYHAIRLRDLSARRKLWLVGQNLVQAGTSEVETTDEAHQKAVEGINAIFDKAQGVSTLGDAIKSLGELMTRNRTHDGVVTGTRTGFDRFDEKGGLHKSDLVIVAGETSQGKTSFVLSMTRNAIESGAKVAFYSMEMTKEQLTARLLASKTGISANDILYSSQLTSEDWGALDEAMAKLPCDNLFFDDKSTSSLESILLSIRMMKLQSNIDGAVIDYLQILNVNSRNANFSRENAMGDTARRLKNLAKELDIWIIALSQLARDRNNPVPNLNRLRDSGQIGEAADVVMLIYRPEYYNLPYPSPYENTSEYPTEGTAMIDVAKGRNIGTFKFFLGFDKRTTNFYVTDDMQHDAEQEFSDEPDEWDAPF